jgi:hypothetical protein
MPASSVSIRFPAICEATGGCGKGYVEESICETGREGP